MRTLVRKELRQLLPVAFFVFITMTAQVVYEPIASRPDELIWPSLYDIGPGEGGLTQALLSILALMVAYSLFPREYDEGTIEFLYALPLKRSWIFTAKILAASTVLLGGIALDLLVDLFLLSLNPQTFSSPLDAGLALRLFFLLGTYSLVVLSHGVVLSFMRRFGLIVYGIYWWILWGLKSGPEPVSWLDHSALLTWEYFGTTLLIPWQDVLVQVSLAVMWLGLARLLWTFQAESAKSWYVRMSATTWGRALMATAVVGIAGLSISIFLRAASDSEEDGPPAYYRSFGTARYSSKHYSFTYPASQRSTSMDLMKQADECYERVKESLSAESVPRITVDLTEVSDDHAGIAGWKKIRMGLLEGGAEDFRRTLYHETTHVFQMVESGGRMSDHAESTQFFVEGLAEAIAYQEVPQPEVLDARRLVGALAWDRLGIRFEEMARNEAFRRKYDENLYYTLGELWADALIRTCGKEAPGDVLRALAREAAPRDLEGTALWQDTLQAIGCDLEIVNSAWRQEMSELASSRAEREVPRISGGVARIEDGDIIAIGYLDRKIDDGGFLLRVRDSEADLEEDVQVVMGFPREEQPLEVEYEIPAWFLTGRRFEFQFCYRHPVAGFCYSEAWQSADVPEIP